MDFLEKMNGVIEYIEDNLTKCINYDEAAKIVCCSTYHFQRMFSFITDISLSEYIRRRRLTLAALELQRSNIKVMDVALKYGYDSPEAFARAFKNLHGVSPTVARRFGSKLKSYPPMSFHISIKGEIEMNYRFEQTDDFEVFGKDILIKTNDDPYEILPRFGYEIYHNGTHDKINEIAGKPKGTLLYGIYFDFKEDQSRRYMFGWHRPNVLIPDEFITLKIPKATWVVFEGKGKVPNLLATHQLWKRIYSEWFPKSGYNQAEGPCIEKHYWIDENQGLYTCEIWIPVKV